MHEDAQWAMMNSEVLSSATIKEPFEGYRIPQLMDPWIAWDSIIHKYHTLSRAVFFNEVLGLSFDSGTRPLTPQDVIDNCDNNVLMTQEALSNFRAKLGGSNPVFAGIDWGSGEGSYTLLTLGTYVEGKFRVFYLHRFMGAEAEPAVQMDLIEQIIKSWNVTLVGTDYGGGFFQNDILKRKFGTERIATYQYSQPSVKVKWDGDLKRFLIHRTEVMSDIFNAIKRRNVFQFPAWSQFKSPFGDDLLNIFSEYNEQQRQIQYKKSPDSTDDTFHSILLCFLASMLRAPRPDILNPSQRTGILGDSEG
jgi:hypothetical protein